jgi:hypothetical protein
MLRKGERARKAGRVSSPLQPAAVETEVSYRGTGSCLLSGTYYRLWFLVVT